MGQVPSLKQSLKGTSLLPEGDILIDRESLKGMKEGDEGDKGMKGTSLLAEALWGFWGGLCSRGSAGHRG